MKRKPKQNDDPVIVDGILLKDGFHYVRVQRDCNSSVGFRAWIDSEPHLSMDEVNPSNIAVSRFGFKKYVPNPGDTDIGKGEWYVAGPENQVWYRCPNCGISSPLLLDVADNGAVLQSLRCWVGSCEFHEFVKLLDWEPSNGIHASPSMPHI